MEKELIAKWNVRESETQRILALLPELVEASTSEEGNLLYAVYQSETDPNEIILHERYKNEEAFEAHKQSTAYQEIVAKQIIPFLENRELTFLTRII